MVEILPLTVLSELAVLETLFMLSERSSQRDVRQMMLKLGSEDYSTICRTLLDRVVKIHASRLTDELLSALVNSGSRYIDVSNCSKVTAAGFKQLLHRCTKAEVLNLTDMNHLTSAAFMCDLVLATFTARTLTCLILDNTSIVSEVVQCLICLPSLRQLSLAQCKNITNDAFFCATESVRLTSVNVAGCRHVTTLGIVQLTKLCGFTLQHLNISGSGVDYMAFFFIAGLRLLAGRAAWTSDNNSASPCHQTAASYNDTVSGDTNATTASIYEEVSEDIFLNDARALKEMLRVESLCESRAATLAQRSANSLQSDSCENECNQAAEGSLVDFCTSLGAGSDVIIDDVPLSTLHISDSRSSAACDVTVTSVSTSSRVVYEASKVELQTCEAHNSGCSNGQVTSSSTSRNSDETGIEIVSTSDYSAIRDVDAVADSCVKSNFESNAANSVGLSRSAKVLISDTNEEDLPDLISNNDLSTNDSVKDFFAHQRLAAGSSLVEMERKVQLRLVRLYKPVLLSLEANDLKFVDTDLARYCLRVFACRNTLLKRLSLSWDGINDEFLESLSKHAPQLRSLQLWGGVSVTSNGLASLAGGCGHLTDLNISGLTFVDDAGLVPLIRLGSLEKLDMSSTEITDATLHAVAAESGRHLEELSISWCDNITVDGLLSVSRNCCALRKLCMRQMPTTGYMLSLMAERCRQLVELNLSCVAELNDASLAVIALNLKLLQVLDISWNEDVTDVGLSSLLLYCPRLRSMCLCGLKRITSKPFLPIIAEYASWRRCQTLLRFKLRERQMLDASELDFSSDEEYEDLCLPHRSMTYACCLNYLELDYCDLIDDTHFNEIVAVCRGTLHVVDYYHQNVEPIWVTCRHGVIETHGS